MGVHGNVSKERRIYLSLAHCVEWPGRALQTPLTHSQCGGTSHAAVFPGLCCGLAGFHVNICTAPWVQHQRSLCPVACCALWVEQGKITYVIFHVILCPGHASPTTKERQCFPSHAFVIQQQSVLCGETSICIVLGIIINSNVRILEHSVILTTSSNILMALWVQTMNAVTLAFTPRSPLSLLWSHQLGCKPLFMEGLYLFVLYTL